MREKIDSRFLVIMGIVLFGVFGRILTNGLIPNFAPIGAIALFSGAYFRDKKVAFLIPMLAMFLSDLFIGFHETMIFVYLGFAITVLLGFSLRTNESLPVGKTVGVTLASALIFFFLTNAGVWLMYDFYPKGLSGLWMSLTAGIPFLRMSVLGDFFYVAIFFGAFEWIKSTVPSFKVVLK